MQEMVAVNWRLLVLHIEAGIDIQLNYRLCLWPWILSQEGEEGRGGCPSPPCPCHSVTGSHRRTCSPASSVQP